MITQEAFAHYRTGVEEMDNEHWKLFQLLNCLIESTSHSAAKNFVDMLCTAWHEHQVHEEDLMQQANYPYVSGHIEQHKHIYGIFDKLHSTYSIESSHIAAIVEYAREATLLLLDHVDYADSQYKSYLLRISAKAT